MVREVAILSTCNRTEIYAELDAVEPQELLNWLATFHKTDPLTLQSCHYSYAGIEAARHMMKVASGLDSLVLGEPQILGQVKQSYRLAQEVVLGFGGLEMLRKLEHPIDVYHMNEGHSALLALRLAERLLAKNGHAYPNTEDVAAVRRQCVFTTHTPVPAGHDQFPGSLVREVLGEHRSKLLFSTGFTGRDHLNMTHLALHHSNYVNGVAMKHGEVSREMFPEYRVKALTNGVVPMGAVAVNDKVHNVLMDAAPEAGIELFHGYTYSGHPVACAAGIAMLDTCAEEGLLTRASELEKHWEEAAHALKGARHVIDVRNFGLMAAVELEPRPGAPGARAYEAFVRAFEAGVLIRVTADIIALSPPLIVEKPQIDRIFQAIRDAVSAVA